MRRLIAGAFITVVLGGTWTFGGFPAQAAPNISGNGMVYGGYYPDYGKNFNSADYNALANATGKRVTFGGSFISVLDDPGTAVPGQWSNTREMLNAIWGGQATPFVNLNIPAKAADIAAGKQDANISRWADHVKLYLDLGGGRSLFVAPMQEMNGDWTAGTYGCQPAQFGAAFRRVVDIFRGKGIDETKVRWAFAPNGWTSPGCGTIESYYPGDAYVDVIGFSSYRFNNQYSDTIQEVFVQWADLISSNHPTKPILVAQTGVWPVANKDQFIVDMFSWAASNPFVVGIIYFNYNNANVPGETDWRIWDGSSVNAGWKIGMLQSSTLHAWPLTSWFQKGTLPFDPFPPVPNVCPTRQACDTVAFQSSGGQFHLWHTLSSPRDETAFFFGNPGDVAFSGDWNCDGVDTPGLYRRSDGYVYLRNSNTQGVADIAFFFGNPGDYPVAGDFNGNQCDTVSIYRPSQARFYIINQLGSNDGGLGAAEYAFYFGNVGDKPFVGDFDGDGVDTVGLHRESTGLVYFRNSNTTGVADSQFIYGDPGDKLVAGDWDGNGSDTVAVYRPSNGMFYVKLANVQGNADATIYAGTGYTGLVAIRR